MPRHAQYVSIVYDYVTCEVLRIIVPDRDDTLPFHPLARSERMIRVRYRAGFTLDAAQAAVLRATGRPPS